MVFTHDELSIPVRIVKKQNKRMYLRLKLDHILITTSTYASMNDIRTMLETNRETIVTFYRSVVGKKEEVHLLGKAYLLEIVIEKKSRIAVEDERMIIYAPHESGAKKMLYTYYANALKQMVEELLPEARSVFHEISIPPIVIQALKSVHGSYNRKKHIIKLSSHLAKYDPKYIKYVLYHELSHVLIFDHSARFYQYFSQKMSNCKTMRKELNKIKYNDYF